MWHPKWHLKVMYKSAVQRWHTKLCLKVMYKNICPQVMYKSAVQKWLPKVLFKNALQKWYWCFLVPPFPPTPQNCSKIGHPGTADFLYSFERGPPQSCTKLPVREDLGWWKWILTLVGNFFWPFLSATFHIYPFLHRPFCICYFCIVHVFVSSSSFLLDICKYVRKKKTEKKKFLFFL